LRLLVEILQPQEISLVIDDQRGLFPVEAAASIPRLTINSINSIAGQRFAHAKLVIASTADCDHILFGSANCTYAALGGQVSAGLNQEACLYRRTLPGELLRDLGISQLLEESSPLDLDDIAPLAIEDAAPLETQAVSPGSFSLQYSTLVWCPSQAMAGKAWREVQLVNTSEVIVHSAGIATSQKSGEAVHVLVSDLASPPAFARVMLEDGSLTLPAIVNVTAILLSECRDRGSKQSQRSIDRLMGDEEEGLWLLDILDGFEDASQADADSTNVSINRGWSDPGAQKEFKVLSYADFVAHSRQRPEGHGVGRNSLAGTEFNYVRTYLNRAIELTRDRLDLEEYDEDAAVRLINSAEPDEIEEALDEERAHVGKPGAAEEDQEREHAARIRERQNRAALESAVTDFIVRLREKRDAQTVSSLDVLRLRVLITILLAAGQSESDEHTSLQVLTKTTGEGGWPLLIGKSLFGMFGGKHPPIGELRLEEEYEQLPDDVLECWACCCWAVHACAQSVDPKNVSRILRIAAVFSAIWPGCQV
jgi:hypothetical protein